MRHNYKAFSLQQVREQIIALSLIQIIYFLHCIVQTCTIDNQMKSQISAYCNRVQAKRFKSLTPKKTPKQVQVSMSHTTVSTLKLIKNTLDSLPSHSNYLLDHESDYLRKISEVLPLLAVVRLQQISYIVSKQTFKKIVIQLIRQRQHKQIVIALLKLLAKGIDEYREIVEKDLYSILEVMIQMQGLGDKISRIKRQEDDLKAMQAKIQAMAVYQLVKSIVRWYSITAQGRVLAGKYKQLLLSFQK